MFILSFPSSVRKLNVKVILEQAHNFSSVFVCVCGNISSTIYNKNFTGVVYYLGITCIYQYIANLRMPFYWIFHCSLS